MNKHTTWFIRSLEWLQTVVYARQRTGVYKCSSRDRTCMRIQPDVQRHENKAEPDRSPSFYIQPSPAQSHIERKKNEMKSVRAPL